MNNVLSIRTADIADYKSLLTFISRAKYVHRHLDWREPRDWLGHQPFLFLMKDEDNVAVLSCPQDPPGVAWIRLFASANTIPLMKSWNSLIQAVQNIFEKSRIETILAAVAINEWFIEPLQNAGFINLQQIVVMERHDQPVSMKPNNNSISIRKMDALDIPYVVKVDNSAFSTLWQLSEEGLDAAYQRSDYATVAIYNDELIGYQISTVNLLNAHLARISVHHDYQGQGVGYALLQDTLHNYTNLGYLSMTVNTQNDNYASISLYKKFNFALTGEKFSVYFKKV